MNRFAFVRARSYEEASTLLTEKQFSLPMIKAGGMDVVDHLKEGLYEPDALIDVKHLGSSIRVTTPANQSEKVTASAGSTLSQLAESSEVNRFSPVVAQACASAATPQVRNVATAAGNLLQRPRCWYYRHDQFDCLKKGGDHCFAVEGENKYHAILGGSPCHIVHPSNLAHALYVCDGEVMLTGGDREKLSITDLYHLPSRDVTSEHNLRSGEVITSINWTAAPVSGFYAIKEKQSFDWPLALACVALEVKGDLIASAKVCAGAVAPIPWMLTNVADALSGVNINDDVALKRACALSVAGAQPMTDNAYKLKLLPVAIHRAILKAVGRPTPA